jgi:hypothetical protein
MHYFVISKCKAMKHKQHKSAQIQNSREHSAQDASLLLEQLKPN